VPHVVHADQVKPETWAVMGGRGTPSAGTPLNVPPVLASNFELGSERAYSRDDATPTWEAFEQLLGGLEGGLSVAFASGMGAVAAIADLLPVGATVVLADDCYQGVAGLAAAGAAQGRWRVVRVAVEDTAGWLEAAAQADLLWLESPSNPLLAVADLPAVCAARRKPHALVAVDSTLATPLVQRPLELGADLVVHSATKYLGGHSDLLLGAAVARSDAVARRLRERRELAGATPGALEAYLATRGVRTLALRLERASTSAARLAEHLGDHPGVAVVRYPGRGSHPTHATARRFMRGFGAVVSFEVHGGAERADAVCRSLRIIRHATSLGGVESTIERRAAIPGQTHLPPGLLRLSVGCEHVDDLWTDLDQALARTAGIKAAEPSRQEDVGR
jgi:cystathionine gamma-synthase